MKYLFILLLMLAVAVFFYWRLRPYIRAARRFLAVVREAQRVGEAQRTAASPGSSGLPRRERVAGEKLARCAACGTWLPAPQAVTLRATGVSYCSHACLERAADAPRARKSAS